MIDKTDFETFLYISKYKFQIFVYNKKKLKNLYKEEIIFFDKFNLQDLNNLSKFLDNNIYKIEKLIGDFIRNIVLIIENEESFHVNISVKKKNYENNVEHKYLKNSLIELKDLFRENYQNYRIMHMVVVNHINDKEKKYYSVNMNNNDYFCLELDFIAITNYYCQILEKALEKYQIKISHYMCGDYIKNFYKEDNSELSTMAYKIKNGINENEVTLVSKNTKNKGFFEKFFQLFS